MESAERITKALEKTGEFLEEARQSGHFSVKAITQMETAEAQRSLIQEKMKNKLIVGPLFEEAFMALILELSKLHLEKIEQLIESMREIQKILFSTRNKRSEEAIKYIEQVCDKSDNNFNSQLRLIKPKYNQWFMGQQATDGDSTEVNVTTEITHQEVSDDAFKILALVFHPDKGGDTERFQIINNAHEHIQQMDSDQVKVIDFNMLRIVMLYLIQLCNNVNKFSDIQKILAEKKPESS